MHPFPVEAVEVDALGTDGHRPHKPLDAGMLGVRHGHAATDTRAAQLLSLQDRLDDALILALGDLVGRKQGLHHFPDHALFVVRRYFSPDRFPAHEVGKLHATSPFSISSLIPPHPGRWQSATTWCPHVYDDLEFAACTCEVVVRPCEDSRPPRPSTLPLARSPRSHACAPPTPADRPLAFLCGPDRRS